jgi:hypothetical protein
VTARQPLLDVGFGVHPQNLFPISLVGLGSNFPIAPMAL